jgi:hypothetical protein
LVSAASPVTLEHEWTFDGFAVVIAAIALSGGEREPEGVDLPH